MTNDVRRARRDAPYQGCKCGVYQRGETWRRPGIPIETIASQSNVLRVRLFACRSGLRDRGRRHLHFQFPADRAEAQVILIIENEGRA